MGKGFATTWMEFEGIIKLNKGKLNKSGGERQTLHDLIYM